MLFNFRISFDVPDHEMQYNRIKINGGRFIFLQIDYCIYQSVI